MGCREEIRIAQIIGKWVGGGVEAVVMNYYRNIDHTKVQFDFICDEDSTNIPYSEIEAMGGRVILIPPYQKVFEYHKKLKEILIQGHYKIVHSHINALSLFSLWAAKSAHVPVRIAHSHSTSNPKEVKKNLIKNCLRPFSKVFATDYFCCSELAGRWLFGSHAYCQGKVYLLSNAIDLKKFFYQEDIRKKMREELNISKDTLVIGHIGRFVEQKNHDFLIDVFQKIHEKNPNSILLLVGQGPLEHQIKEKVSSLKLDDCVRFLGQISNAHELYQAFDLFILPSLYEGLGMVLIEAQCSGVPCLSSSEVPKIVKINPNFKFLSLQTSSTTWSCESLRLFQEGRYSSKFTDFRENGYDIQTEAKKLERIYIEKDRIR